MQFYRVAAVLGLLVLLATAGCGYLPSEMAPPDVKKNEGTEAEAEPAEAKPAKKAKAGSGKTEGSVHAHIRAKPHSADCSAPAQGFQRVVFSDLYTATGGDKTPFREADDIPARFDVAAYVWGYDQCSRTGTCEGGDRYWLIGKGPREDFKTWVVTPQFPRITIQSSCREKLKVGERFRFSFSHGKLVGFSR